MDDLLREFLTETNESLDTVDVELVRFEQEPNNAKILDNIFRLVHTIKGTCGFLGFNKLEKVAHVGENLLTRLRDGQLTLNPELTTALLGMVDAVRQILGQIEAAGQEGERDDSILIATLAQLREIFFVAAVVLTVGWLWLRARRRDGWGESKLIYDDLPAIVSDLGLRG